MVNKDSVALCCWSGGAAERAEQPATEPAYHTNDGWHFSIEKMFVYFSFVAAVMMFVVFGLDLLKGILLRRASVLFDVTNVIAGITLVYLSWNTHRDLV